MLFVSIELDQFEIIHFSILVKSLFYHTSLKILTWRGLQGSEGRGADEEVRRQHKKVPPKKPPRSRAMSVDNLL